MKTLNDVSYFSVRDQYLATLRNELSAIRTAELLSSIWQIRAIQSGETKQNTLILNFPDVARTDDPTNKYFLHPWRLETLANIALMNQANGRKSTVRNFDAKDFRTVVKFYSDLGKIEDASDGISLDSTSVLTTLFRLTSRQFEWQYGHAISDRLYRYFKIYVTEKSKKFFFDKYGIELLNFMKLGFAIYSTLNNQHALSTGFDISILKICEKERDHGLSIYCIPLEDAKELAIELRKKFRHVGYAPSIFRSFPCVRTGGLIISPFVDLIFNRFTENLFYDFVGDGGLREEFGGNFETYIFTIFNDQGGNFSIAKEMKYSRPERLTPDLFIIDKGNVVAAFELKSRKLGAAARFNADPIMDAEEAYKEIANGICQLWKYAEDSGNQTVPLDVRASNSTKLVLLTLDDWVGMSPSVLENIYLLANEIADKKSLSKLEFIRRAVIICTTSEIEIVLSKGPMEKLILALDASQVEKYRGWMISTVWNDLFAGDQDELGNYFNSKNKLNDIWPWWKELSEAGKASVQSLNPTTI